MNKTTITNNFLISIFLFLFLPMGLFSQTFEENVATVESDEALPDDPNINESDILVRLRDLNNECVKMRYTTEVKGYIRGYAQRNRHKTEDLLGRITMYLPTVEKLLSESGLPNDLKYLAVLESALNPNAVSSAGATGLWQFMAPTAGEYGLVINQDVDERKDVYKSTKAALKYLSRLYSIYNSWELALAAYNCGPGKINAVLKRARTKDYWRIRNLLTKETRNYIPAFIAANYISKFYMVHNLRPNLPNMDLQVTNVTRVYDFMPFSLIAQITDLPLSTIKILNPSYLNDFIPSSAEGNYVVLPRRVSRAFLDYINRPDSRPQFVSNSILYDTTEDPIVHYDKTSYIAQGDEDIESIAKYFNCSPYNLKVWNNINTSYVYKGQKLTVFLPKEVKRHVGVKDKLVGELETTSVNELEDRIGKEIPNVLVPKVDNNGVSNYIFHRIKRNETIADIAGQYPGSSIKEIVEENSIRPDNMPSVGDKIKVRIVK